MPSVPAKEEVSQLAKSQKHTFSEAYSQHLEGRSQRVGVGFQVVKIPGENRQLNFVPVSVSGVGVDVASCMLGVRVSLLLSAVIEDYAQVLDNCWLDSSKNQSCQGFLWITCPLEDSCNHHSFSLSTLTPSLSKY